MARDDERGERRERVKYRVLEAKTPDELEELVELHLEKGWELQGGVCIMSVQNSLSSAAVFYGQAVKRRS